MIKLFLKSIIIGVANIIPGVSGGTVAIILNVYDDIIEKIANFLNVDLKKKIEYFKYLFVVVLGVGVGVIIFANLIEFSIKNYPKITSTFFTLLIALSIPYIVKGLNYKKLKNMLSFVIGSLFVLIFVYFNLKYEKNTSFPLLTYNLMSSDCFERTYLIKLFISGALAGGAMIIPGISGSLLLLMLGEYYNILSFIKNFSIKPLIFVALGVGLGLIVFSKLISLLLNTYREITLFFLTGIITFSILQIWINIL